MIVIVLCVVALLLFGILGVHACSSFVDAGGVIKCSVILCFLTDGLLVFGFLIIAVSFSWVFVREGNLERRLHKLRCRLALHLPLWLGCLAIMSGNLCHKNKIGAQTRHKHTTHANYVLITRATKDI